jgi:glycosyltransferase involved in cell wall biosynthesis
MNVWVVKTSEMLAGDNGNGRLLRSGIIAHILDERGHDVTWWMSTFDHANRRNRFQQDQQSAFGTRGQIRMIYSPGYKASISMGRLVDHSVWGSRFARAIRAAAPPDVIFCAYPTIEAASVCVRYGRSHNIPVVLDLRDMWPDIFLERVPAALLPLARMVMWPLARRARLALAGATALFGITEDFLQWGLGLAGRARTAWDGAFPLAYPRTDLNSSPAGEPEAALFWDSQGVSEQSAFNVVLVGSITRRRFELDAVLAAARALQAEERPVRFIIAGDGDDLPMYRENCRDCSNVIFPGWLSKPQIQVLLGRAHLGLVPYRNSADLVISIPNKVAEYFAAGLPVATCLRGTLSRLLQERQCGLPFSESEPQSLVALVRTLRDDEALRGRLAANASATFQESFVAEAVYGRLSDRLQAIADAHGPQMKGLPRSGIKAGGFSF